MANAFETLIEGTFSAYRQSRIATLMVLQPRMRIAGMRGRVPCWVQVQKAPYDVMGYYHKTGATIGAELKETRDPKTSLPIVAPGSDSKGLEYHQLEGLVDLHENGGTALLLWSNAGQIGRLDGKDLAAIKDDYDVVLKARNPPRGGKSIPWDRFREVKTGHGGIPLWLPKPKSS